MKVHNIRLGHATNSSSSHSLIFDPSLGNQDDNDSDYFGWNYFTCSSKESKDEYLSAIFDQNFRNSLPDSLVSLIKNALNLPNVDMGIDHQSLYNIPYEFGTNIPSVEFFNDFRQYILKDGIHILGGNDNDEDNHPLYDSSKVVSFDGYEPDQNPMICRKDGQWWTLFNKSNGNRIVFSFEDNPEPFEPLTPMLTDFKCTNYCDFACIFCFQGSTKTGEHMKESDIYYWVNSLKTAKVFEIAIGGGEPTKFPGFLRLVKDLNNAGISVNFTTKNSEWLEDEKFSKAVMENIGAFAYSADDKTSISTLEHMVNVMKYHRYPMDKMTFQVIPAVFQSDYSIEAILKFAHNHHIRVTLLGFKETGRGAAFKDIQIKKFAKGSWGKFSETDWIKLVQKLHNENECPMLSIDTTLAGRYQKELKEIGIPEWLYHIEEGKYSMYIDAVTNSYGPSSYHLDDLKKIDNVYHLDIEQMFNDIEVKV